MDSRRSLARTTALLGVASVVAVGLPAVAAADPVPPAAVVHTFTSPLTLQPGASVEGTAKLDDNCMHALTAPNGDQGLSYSITATSDSATVVIASAPSPVSLSDCTSSQSFTLSAPATAPACSTAIVTFQPTVYNPSGKTPRGQQQKVTSTSLTVNIAGTDCDGSGGGDVGDGRPAAPAVANRYINGMTPKAWALGACAEKYKKAGKLWRGALIKDVAAQMPKPESIKNDSTIFPSAEAWFDYVIAGVDTLCADAGGVAFPPPTSG